jgi:SAM-dependent methyltransferase
LGNPLEWQVAYPELFARMGFGTDVSGPVLDYGCGPGAVASFLAERYAHEVVGCDISSDMIGLAERQTARPGLEFVHLTDGRLPHLTDGHFGAAICTFVLCVLQDKEQHLAIGREVHRLLRPDAPFGIVVPHPDSAGIQFSTCRSGDPGVSYSAGDPMTTRLKGHGNILEIEDWFWPAEWYEKFMVECGFHSVTAHAPLAPPDEPPHPPFLLVTGRR